MDSSENILETLSQRSDCQIVYEEEDIQTALYSKEETRNAFEITYQKEDLENESQNDIGLQEKEGLKEWKKLKADDLKKKLNPIIGKNIQKTCDSQSNNRKVMTRRRPTLIRALTSSKLGEKYNFLIDKKLELLECYRKEHDLRMESLKLDIALKKKELGINEKNLDVFLVDTPNL